MKTALHKRTMRYIQEIKDTDINNYPTQDWIIDPDKKAAVNGVPRKYWKISAGKMAEKTEPEKMATDLQNPAPDAVIGVTKIVDNPSRLKIVNGIVVEAS